MFTQGGGGVGNMNGKSAITLNPFKSPFFSVKAYQTSFRTKNGYTLKFQNNCAQKSYKQTLKCGPFSQSENNANSKYAIVCEAKFIHQMVSTFGMRTDLDLYILSDPCQTHGSV